MADAIVSYEATNIFGLHENFNTAGSTTSTPLTNHQVLDETGNVACQKNVTDITNYTQSGITYCGSDLVGDLGTMLTQFGNVTSTGILMNSLTINFAAGGGYATIELAGHQHAANAHAAGITVGYADVSDFLPHEAAAASFSTNDESFYNWDGTGIPDFGINLGTPATATPSGGSVTFSFGAHDDKTDGDGNHFVGKNLTPTCSLSLDFEGIPADNTAALIQVALRKNGVTAGGGLLGMYSVWVDDRAPSDANTTGDTFSFPAHANPSLTV